MSFSQCLHSFDFCLKSLDLFGACWRDACYHLYNICGCAFRYNITCISCASVYLLLYRAEWCSHLPVACCSIHLFTRGTRWALHLLFMDFVKKIWAPGRRCSCCMLDVPWNAVANGCHPAVVVKEHHMSDPPDFTQLDAAPQPRNHRNLIFDSWCGTHLRILSFTQVRCTPSISFLMKRSKALSAFSPLVVNTQVSFLWLSLKQERHGVDALLR